MHGAEGLTSLGFSGEYRTQLRIRVTRIPPDIALSCVLKATWEVRVL
jgi:hypothetical protein